MKEDNCNTSQSRTEFDAVSRTLSSIYTGVFLIDLMQDTYSMIKATQNVEKIIDGIVSAQEALNTAIKQTVFQNEMIDMLAFVNLATLPSRMSRTNILNTDYRGIVSGWVRGSFMEVKRDETGNLTQILYTYQVIDNEKRKELRRLDQLKKDYAQSEKENKENRKKTAALEVDRQVLTDDLQYHNNFTKDVMEQLNCGIIVYTIPGRNLLEINKEALRIFGWKTKEEAVKNFVKKQANIQLTDHVHEMQLMKLREIEGSVKYQFTLGSGQKDEKLLLAESKSLSGRYGGKVIITTISDVTNVRNLEADKLFLTDANTELQRARDAVQTILKSGSYLCVYAEDGESLLSIKFSDALRKLYGYSGKGDAPDTWQTW